MHDFSKNVAFQIHASLVRWRTHSTYSNSHHCRDAVHAFHNTHVTNIINGMENGDDSSLPDALVSSISIMAGKHRILYGCLFCAITGWDIFGCGLCMDKRFVLCWHDMGKVNVCFAQYGRLEVLPFPAQFCLSFLKIFIIFSIISYFYLKFTWSIKYDFYFTKLTIFIVYFYVNSPLWIVENKKGLMSGNSN